MPVPNLLSLTVIADGARAVAADVRSNFAAIQSPFNTVLGYLGGASDGNVLTWDNGLAVWKPKAGAKSFNVKDYGAKGDNVTDDTAAITAALAAVAAVGGGMLDFPLGTYVTTGGHSIGVRCHIIGAGMGATVIRHTGNNVCFSYLGGGAAAASWEHTSIRDLAIHGTNAAGTTDNTGASAGAIYLEDSIGFLLRNVGVGYQIGVATKGLYTVGYALRLHNRIGFCEQNILDNFKSLYNQVGIRMTRGPSGAGSSNSFGWNRFRNVTINTPTNGVGIDCDSGGTEQSRFYNGELFASVTMPFTGAVAVDVGAFFQIEDSTFGNIKGECYTPTCTFIKNRGGQFRPTGLTTLETDGSATNNLALGTNKLKTAGAELNYVSRTTDLAITATTALTAQTVLTSTALVYDGSPIVLEFACSDVQVGTGVGTYISLNLWEDGVDLGPWGAWINPSAGGGMQIPTSLKLRRSATVGSHTYVVKAWRGFVDGNLYARTDFPISLRITVA